MRKTPTTATATRRRLAVPTVAVFASAALAVAYWDSWPAVIGGFGLLFAVPALDDAVKARRSLQERGVFVVVYEWVAGLATGLATLALLGVIALLGVAFIVAGVAMAVAEGEWGGGILSVGLGLFTVGCVVSGLRGK